MEAKTLTDLREIIHRLILEHANRKPSHGEIDSEAIIDDDKGHYEVLRVGWHGDRRVHGSVIHIDVKDDKIWIQNDGTSPGVAMELVEAGIPRDAIVLAFHPARVRQHTGFAVG